MFWCNECTAEGLKQLVDDLGEIDRLTRAPPP